MYCKNCGKEVEDGKEYCADCEKTMSNQGATETPVQENVAQNTTTTTTQTTNTQTVNNTATNNQPKSKMAAGLLGIFLGAFGVHNFYLGYTGKAIAQLLITVLSCFTLSVASEIWGLIEGILILTGSINTDAQGNPLKD